MDGRQHDDEGRPANVVVPLTDRLLLASTVVEPISLTASWWFPPTSPRGLIWLQHGFARTKERMASLARHLCLSTPAVVVTPTVSSRFVGRQGRWINGEAMHEAIAASLIDRTGLQASADRAAARTGRSPTKLPDGLVLSGHSAGGNLALAVAGLLAATSAIDEVRGVVLLDGVDHGGSMGRALDRLTGDAWRPVWTVAAPPSACNGHGRGTRLLHAKRPDRFVGVELVDGTHVDAEGDGTWPAKLVCGRPRAENVAAVRDLAADWTAHLLDRTPDTALLTETAPGTTNAVGAARAITLG